MFVQLEVSLMSNRKRDQRMLSNTKSFNKKVNFVKQKHQKTIKQTQEVTEEKSLWNKLCRMPDRWEVKAEGLYGQMGGVETPGH